MACLNISAGLFINVGTAWLPGDQTTSDGTISIDNNPGGGYPGMTITRISDGSNVFITGDNVRSITFGNRFILTLKIQSLGGSVTYSTSLIRTTQGMPLDEIGLFFITVPNGVSPPVVSYKNDVFLIWTASGGVPGNATNLSIRSAHNGSVLCSAVPFQPTLQISGEATASQLLIKHGGSTIDSCPIPVGICKVTPEPNNFPNAVLGTANASQIRQFTILNTGTNCLIINGTTDLFPYTRVATSRAFPATLDPSQSMTVDIRFAPTTVGTYNVDLPIQFGNTAGSGSDTTLKCRGIARNPIISITFPAAASFGRVPLMSSGTRTINIQNNGEISVTLNIGASPVGIPFSWGAFSGNLSPGAIHSLSITFTPGMEANFTQTITFTSSAASSPHTINLTGIGCVANSEIQVIVPPGPFVNLGEIQRGFRTVRTIRVVNNGDGPLNFSARIQGGTAMLFGIQPMGSSITSPLSNSAFSVLPLNPCGGSPGTGEVLFGITFFANNIPDIYQSQLIIFNHNATNGISPELSFNLQATITPPISVDLELVLDRSGSMSEISGERTKIDTAIDAGQLFVSLMRPDVEDRLGIVSFNNTINVLSSIQNISTGNQNSIRGQINNSNFNPTGATSIAGGVRVAIKNIDDNPRAIMPAELNTCIIVLTDGKDNSSYNDPDGNTYSLLGGSGTLPLPIPTGKKIYAVGIGNSIDTAQLSVLAQSSGGNFLAIRNFSGNDYFSLEKHFTQIFMEAVDLAIISDPVYTIQPNDKHIIPLDILDGDTALMIVVYDREFIRLPFYLETPKEEIIELSSIPSGFQLRSGITKTARFMEVKFPVGEPERYAGKWNFIIYHDGRACSYNHSQGKNHASSEATELNKEFSFGFQPFKCEENYNKPILYGVAVGVGSNFRMFPFVQPGITKVGESIKLNALVSEFDLPVLGCNVTVQVDTPGGSIYNYILADDGIHEDDEVNDGNYGKLFLNTFEEGFYSFTFRAMGYTHNNESVFREAVRSKYVEGVTPVIPPDKNCSNGDQGKFMSECCRRIRYFLWIIIVLLVVFVLFMWLR